jgi:hypothetical protein
MPAQTARNKIAGHPLIPGPADHDLYAQLQTSMDMIRQGWSVSLFQALQQWSTMLSKDWGLLALGISMTG